jgi:hypothetical protein
MHQHQLMMVCLLLLMTELPDVELDMLPHINPLSYSGSFGIDIYEEALSLIS